MAFASFKERQNDELQVLQAVFMEDFKDLRKKDTWKVDRSPEVCLTLKPQQSDGNQGGETYVHVDLIFSCPSNYPEVVPEIKLENSKGLSNHQIATLQADLDKEAKTLVGEEMMLQLSQTVQTFLYANNNPPPKSFYEEMMCNKRKQEEKQAQEQLKKQEFLRKKEEKEMLIIEGEIQKRKEALKEETRKRKEETRQASLDRDTPVSTPTESPIKSGSPADLRFVRRSVSPSPAVIVRPSNDQDTKQSRRRRTSTPRCGEEDTHQCKHHAGGIVILDFNTKSHKTVHMGTCLGHGLHGSTVYAGIETKTGDLVAISEWVLKWRQVSRKNLMNTNPKQDIDKEAETYMKQILSIEQEMFSLLKLNHRNLLHYLAFKYQEEQGRITVYVLMEYSGGQNLEIYLTRKRLPVDVLRQYTEELLESLEYLHNKAVVHKNLRASSVFVDMNGRVRLADYSINKRLCDLFNLVEESKPGVKFTDNRSHVTGRGGKKADIYQLGQLVLSLSQGSQVEDLSPTIPSSLPATFQDFLSKCLIRDDSLRWSASQLLDHQFLKEPIPHLIAQHHVNHDQDNKNVDKKDNAIEEEEELHPFVTAWEASGQSRLTNEFEMLKSLGKGGFGDVIKVKNKLDGRLYAIKRIPLNPKSQQFNRKITREVKLLSRLNHENVVRYYNSWIETSDDLASSESSSSISGTPKNSESEKKVSLPSYFAKNSLNMTDDIEKFAPQMENASMDFSISYEISRSRSHGFQGGDDDSDSSSSSDSDDGDEEMFGLSFMESDFNDSSDNVVFEHFDQTDLGTSQGDGDKSKKDETTEQSIQNLTKQYLYIQMEYCDKSTLRNCIDAGMYQDVDLVWRLFREIVEGLLHIHEQGMIHRDLKPVNIFMDSNDHVKIGDFGLATSDILSKSSIKDNTLFMTSAGDIHDHSSRSGSLGDGNLTGRVGTALYVSPEMMTIRQNKVTYSQKVDIYSLGIIFFEMCYKPLQTNMERVKILGQLRSEEVILPEDFDQIEMESQGRILKWLLNHDPNQRPTSKELLKSQYIPPPKMEEAELNEILRSTISDPQSKSYHRMVNALFSQNVSLADDHVYDSDIHKGSFSIKSSLTHHLVHDTLVKVFQRHGAIRLNTPLLIPRPKMYEHVDQYTCLMDHSGRLVGLPFDLRVPFARYITRTHINHVKRYCIERVFRKKKVSGFHPRELTECAFDIVTTNPVSLISDAEVMVVAQDIINEFPPLQQRNYYFRLNHTSLLKAVLLHVGIPEDKHNSVFNTLAEVKRDATLKLKALSNLSISEQTASMLLNLLETEGPFGKVSSILRTVTKAKGEAGCLAKQGLHELEAVITNAQHMGLKLPVIVSVGWIFNTQLYNGTLFQVSINMTRKKKTVTEVLAAGGRYDNLINQFESPRCVMSGPVTKQCGVGISIAFEKVVAALLEQEDFQPPSAYDILVCTIGRKPILKERMNLVRDLWNAGLKAEILHETLEGQEEIQDFCRAHGVSQLVILKDSEGTTVKVRSIDKEKITEKVISTHLLVEFLQTKLQTIEVEQKPNAQNTGGKTNMVSQSHTENNFQTSSSGSNISFNFLMQDSKLAPNARRKYEALIVPKLTTSFPSWLSAKCIEVIALELNVNAIRVIAAYLDIDSTESAFESSIGAVIEKTCHHSMYYFRLPRHKKYMSKITDLVHRLVFDNNCNCIVLYAIKDDSMKLLTSS